MFSGHFSKLFSASLLFAANVLRAGAFDVTRNDNLAVYWGQNSYGATHGSDTANWQKNLASYCQDSTINVIPLAFLHVFFSTGGLPEINLSSTCSSATNGAFPGTSLANCQFMANDIKTCQANGKIVTLSLGGATGALGFSSDAQAVTFAQTIWDLFLGGSSSTRPFGNAVLDGIDLDIEGGGTTGYVAFVNKIRSLASGASKKYYVTAAPQCVYPDAYLGSTLNAVGFDMVYVQFYNNWCGLQNYNNANAWNFGQWDNWAKTVSPNKNVKIYIGGPAAPTAAGSGYVDAATFGNIAKQTRSQYSSFGGIMLWDASQAYANGRYDSAVKNAMGGGSGTTFPTSTPTSSTSNTPTSTPGSGSCAGVAAWSSGTAYNGGARVTYNGHLWTAKWWTQADTPGGQAGVWTDNGACSSRVATSAPAVATSVVSKAPVVTSHAPVKGSAAHSVAPVAESKVPKETPVDSSIHKAPKETPASAPGKRSRLFRL